MVEELVDVREKNILFDRHVHFSGALPERFLRTVLDEVQQPGRPHQILAAALASPLTASLFERIQVAMGIGGRTANYETFFLVYSVVNGACQEARVSDPAFFARGAMAICESLEEMGVSGCELVVGIMHSLDATFDRFAQLREGIAARGATARVLLRPTLIRGTEGYIPEAQISACEAMINATEFPFLASEIAGFDISGRERADPMALAQYRRLCRIIDRAEDRGGCRFQNSIHLGEDLTTTTEMSDEIYAEILERADRWRIVHGLDFWHRELSSIAPRLRKVFETRFTEFDICPSATQLIHGSKIDFRRLNRFCREVGADYSICTDNPSLLSTSVRREVDIFRRHLDEASNA